MENQWDIIVRVFFDPEIIKELVPKFLTEALPNTLLLTVASLAVGLIVGLALSLLLISDRWWVRLPAQIYVDLFRGLPGLLIIFIIGLGLPLAGVTVLGTDAYPYAILAVGLTEAAYMGEIFRSGIQSIAKGQTEAARSLGISTAETMRFVVLPQAVRNILPPLTGQIIITIKATSLVYVLGLTAGQQELTAAAQSATSLYASMTPFVVAGGFYLIITVPLTHLVNAWERRMRNGRQNREIRDSDDSSAAGFYVDQSLQNRMGI